MGFIRVTGSDVTRLVTVTHAAALASSSVASAGNSVFKNSSRRSRLFMVMYVAVLCHRCRAR